ncbi:hypothetical protein ACQJ1X_27300, partial [Klebsiella pneumoniae]
MTNYFDSPFKGKLLSEQVKNPNIKVGRYSYYSGYYHGHSFDDCARYLFPDRDDVDKLIIGSFCSIGSGASFIMAGNQGHRYDWASSFPFFYMQEEPAFSSALDAFQKAGNTVGTVAKLAMRQPFVLFKGLTFQKLCLPGAFRPGDHHNKMLRPG